MKEEFINNSYIEMLIQDLEENSLGYWDATQDEMAKSLRNLQQENQQLKDEINKISKKELKIMQMLRSIELCTLTKERIDQIEEVMFELNTDDLLKGDKK